MIKIIAEEFRQKQKYAHLVLIVQMIALAVVAGWTFLEKGGDHYFYSLIGNAFSSYWQANFESNHFLTILADLAFAVISSWVNEKINRSQTWSLIPVSAGKLWLSNLFSSILTCIYLFVSQLVLLFLTALPAAAAFTDHNPFFSSLNAFALYPTKNDWFGLVDRIIFILALAFFVYICVSLVNFSSQAIIAFLPVKNGKWTKRFVMAVLTILIVIVAANAVSHFVNFMLNQADLYSNWVSNSLWLSNIALWLLNLLLSFINIFLFSHFVESKADS